MGAWDVAIKREHCCEGIEGTSSEKHSTQSTEDNLKTWLRILPIIQITLSKVSSVIHLRDHALYAWSQVNTVRLRTATSCREFRQSSLQCGRASFNPHLLSGFLLLWNRRYWLTGAEILQHRCVTIQGIFRGVIVWRQGVIYIYRGDGLWLRCRLVALAMEEQEVES